MIPDFRNHPGPTFARVAGGDAGSGGPYTYDGSVGDAVGDARRTERSDVPTVVPR